MQCYKCHGTGIIQGFMHVRGGICFECNGTGVLPDIKRKAVGYSKEFIKSFAGSSFFPEDQTGMNKLVCLSFEGHPTAEQWLMCDGNFFYIGQPVCRSSTWWKVPVELFGEFRNHYNKVYKKTKIPDYEKCL